MKRVTDMRRNGQRQLQPWPLRDRLFVAVMAVACMVGTLEASRSRQAASAPSTLTPVEAAIEAEPLPAIETAVDEPLPDFSAFDDARQKKQAFFDYLMPLVELHNQRLLAEREQVHALAAALDGGAKLDPAQRQMLKSFARRYRVELQAGREREAVSQLIRRVDVIPVSLALIQSANESGWGTSRFAREANNLFGEKCFREGCGIAPGRRQGGSEFARFDAPVEAVASYMHNLNTNPAYLDFRNLRHRLRTQDQPITGPAVADGLHRYSVRGEDYVRELRSMILRNKLHRVDEAASAQQPAADQADARFKVAAACREASDSHC